MKHAVPVSFVYRSDPLSKQFILPADVQVRPVVGYGALYSVTNSGLVIAHHPVQPFLLRQGTDDAGYLRAVLHIRGKRIMAYVHRMVAEAFIPNPEGRPHVRHLNRLKTDNSAGNLGWRMMNAESIRQDHTAGLSGNHHECP